ncbi:alginate lyase family protein [Prolixibacteraceae bacterium Z1-6]|uniref:Alginate lyase family protein n=1 Tax=Draconibacterium aestuarii TaxID=2998507 RepID=A0A9X3F227_9BACT|nr:alginate lyase family protein [Prolixibacteraceae bacterium Z1-6]
MMHNYRFSNGFIFAFFVIFLGCSTSQNEISCISSEEQSYIIENATAFMDSVPETVTRFISERSAGNQHDFYSEGDYWWPDPENPDGPYIRKDGQTNPDNFVAHRHAMIRLSRIVGMQTSAYLLTGDSKFAEATQKHLEAWFVNPDTRMNPSLLYVQAIKGRVTGRGIGIIDAIHLIEVARSVEILEMNRALPKETIAAIKNWFSEFVSWLTTHPYGLDEMNTKNNHATCWVMQVGMFARLSGNEEVLELCRDRFKNVLLPNQMGTDGSFPLELARTKPYGYSLFNLDAFMTCAEILSDEKNSLYGYSTSDGKSMKLGAVWLYPFVKDKTKWELKPDVMYWDEWPVRHPFLLFAGKAYKNNSYIDLWKTLDGYPETDEVLRNLPIRNPLLWILDQPVQ